MQLRSWKGGAHLSPRATHDVLHRKQFSWNCESIRLKCMRTLWVKPARFFSFLFRFTRKRMAALLRKTSGRGTLQQNTGTMGPHIKDLFCVFSSLEKSLWSCSLANATMDTRIIRFPNSWCIVDQETKRNTIAKGFIVCSMSSNHHFNCTCHVLQKNICARWAQAFAKRRPWP